MTEELIDSVVNYFKIVDRMHEAVAIEPTTTDLTSS